MFYQKGVITDTNVRITVLWCILIQSKDMKAGHAMILSNHAKLW
jgi:hypothetical protein